MIIDFKKTKIFFSDQGSGNPVVLLHGFLENSTMWNDFISIWSKRNRIITIDLLGHGKSECLGYIHSMELMAEVVHKVLTHLKIKKTTIIGHSMGGYVALAFAELYPNIISGLCLMNSTYKDDNDELKLLRSRANKMIESNFKNMVRMSFTNLFAHQSRIDYKEAINSALSEALKTTVNGYIAAQEGMRIRLDKKDVFKNLNCKKLIIIGKKDPVIDGHILKKEADDLQSKIIEFPDGHMSHIENREVFSYNIMHFIEKL